MTSAIVRYKLNKAVCQALGFSGKRKKSDSIQSSSIHHHEYLMGAQSQAVSLESQE